LAVAAKKVAKSAAKISGNREEIDQRKIADSLTGQYQV
jgi:hypothetical protein